MQKIELCRHVSREVGFSIEATATIMEALTAAIQKALIEGDSVSLRGFGTFHRKTLAAKVGQNFKGGSVKIPQRTTIRFIPSQQFKDKFKDNLN